MMKQILAATVFMTTLSSFGAKLVCKSQIDAKNERVVLISDAIAMVCQAPVGTDFSNKDITPKICAAATGFLVNTGFISGGAASAGKKIMNSIQIASSVFNDFTTDIVLSTSFVAPKSSSGTFSASLEITAAAGMISGNSVVISKPLNISLNKKETLQNCTLK